MTPQELKASILQLAIQGKLVEQRPEEGTGEELLEKIFAAKGTKGAKDTGRNLTRRRGERGGKAGPSSHVSCPMSSIPSKNITAHSAPPREEIPDSEKPFDIPESWVWVRLGEGICLLSGRDLEPSEYSSVPQRYPYMTGASNFAEGHLIVNRWTDRAVTVSHRGDLLITCKGTIGAMAFNDVGDIHIARQIMAISSDCIDLNYAKVILEAMLTKLQSAANSMIPGISRQVLLNLLIPLPPLAEQKRIVAKIEELLPYIDRYEKAWSKLEDFNKRFPGDMQKSLLQMAIQGKLVDQRPEEGTGEELLEKILATKNTKGTKKNSRAETRIPQPKAVREADALSGVRRGERASVLPREEIPDDEKPFDIPESWVWVRLASVTEMLAGFAFKSTDFKAKGKYRLLRGINLAVGDVRWKDKDSVYVDTITDRMAGYKLKNGDVLIGLDRPWITDGTRVAVFEEDMETYLVQRVLRLRETGCLISAYIALLLHSALLRDSIGDKTTGISVPHISPGQVGNLVIPLPPLAEQKRIVAKLEELLPLCERLK